MLDPRRPPVCTQGGSYPSVSVQGSIRKIMFPLRGRPLTGLRGANTIACQHCQPPPPYTLDISQSESACVRAYGSPDAARPEDQVDGRTLWPVSSPFPLVCLLPPKKKGANVSLTTDKKKSTCEYTINFYHRVAETTRTSLCSNVPVQFPICPKSSPAV